MRLEQLDLNLLVALEVLLEEQNITKSAERLHLSQSATSGILSRLRIYFEDDLLIQVGKKMQPTHFALELQIPVSNVLDTIRNSIIGKRVVEPYISDRHFKIIASDYIIQTVFSNVLVDLVDTAPNLTFEFLTPFSHDSSILSRGVADIMIAPDIVDHGDNSSEKLITDELVCIADKNNELVSDDFSIEQFSSLGHVSVGFAKVSHLSIEKWMIEKMGIKRKVDIITNDFTTMIYTVLNSNRLAVLPKYFALKHCINNDFRILPLPFDAPKLNESIMWHPTLDSDPMHEWLREKILFHSKIYRK